jgi:hypothetical protein
VVQDDAAFRRKSDHDRARSSLYTALAMDAIWRADSFT